MPLSGIGKKSRQQLAKVLGRATGAIRASDVSSILTLSKREASNLLHRWEKQGWVSRIRRGWYLPVPLESETANIAIENPWQIATQAFSPCYIRGLVSRPILGFHRTNFPIDRHIYNPSSRQKKSEHGRGRICHPRDPPV